MNLKHYSCYALIAFSLLLASGTITPIQANAQHGSWLEGDFNLDGLRDAADIDAMTESGNLATGYRTSAHPHKRHFDMNFDGSVDVNDIICWLDLGAVVWDKKSGTLIFYPPTVMGDTDLDGVVEKEDELILTQSESRQLMFPSAQFPSRFSEGDFNGDGNYNSHDWLIWFNALASGTGLLEEEN